MTMMKKMRMVTRMKMMNMKRMTNLLGKERRNIDWKQLYYGHLQIYDLYSSTFIIRLKVDRDGSRKVCLREVFLHYREIGKTEY